MIKDTSGQDTVVLPSMGKKLTWPLVAGAVVLLVSGLVWSSVGGSKISESINRSELRFATLERGHINP